VTTYAQLTADLPLWMSRTDLASMLPGFCSLFEARANRFLRTRSQETAFTGTIDASNEIALPADFAAFKTLWQPGYESTPITPQSLESVVAKYATSGTPSLYALSGSNVRFDGSGDVEGVYFASIPALQTASSNWLSVLAYDAYLFGVLAEAKLYLMDEQRAQLYAARSQNALQDVADTDQRDRFNGPLVARKR
jgi:hypothetical protein